MGKQFDKKITWALKNFTSLNEKIYSDQFVVGGCKWSLTLYPKGSTTDSLSLFLAVPGHDSLPSGWRRHARYRFTVVNKNSEKHSHYESDGWYEEKSPSWGWRTLCPLTQIHDKDGGFLVNGELKIVTEVEVLKVIGKLDVTEDTSTMIESVDVNGFQLLPSQAKSVSRMFERHPEIASEFRPKNENLRKAYMSFLLGLIETMCQSSRELSKDDISDAYAALGSMTDAGFKLDWLVKKLDEMSEKKEKEESGEARLQQMEEEFKDMKQKCSEMEALLVKEKAEVLAAKASSSFDDVV